MEEDGAVKAPVTRLRRRLSVEQSEDMKSPTTPSTPTKKRGKLAAKPQLELIKENTPQNSPTKRNTRKSISRDILEPIEDKVLTPSRRSARTKSNTSIISDSVPNVAVDTPRAIRAARRLSQVGSDNEAPTTPSRVTRRTRKDSTSKSDNEAPTTPARVTRRIRKDSATSTDKTGDSEVPLSQGQNLEEQTTSNNIINEVIAEEPETEFRKSISSDTVESGKSLNISPPRKSPRLQAKKGKTSESQNDNSEALSQDSEIQKDDNKSHKENDKSKTKEGWGKEDSNLHDQLSTSSKVLLNALDSSYVEKSLPSPAEKDNFKSKRQRTKSWSTIVTPNKNEDNFYSDNESVKKKLKKHEKVFNVRLSQFGSGDSKDKTKNVNENSENLHKQPKSLNTSNESNKENLTSHDSSVTELLFQKAPSEDIQSLVFIEDSDTDSIGKQFKSIGEPEDQCVPTVPEVCKEQNKPLHSTDSDLNKQDENQVINIFATNIANSIENSCEPMDIDETMPENVTLNDSTESRSRKSSHCLPQDDNTEKRNESRRKSSITTHDPEKSKSRSSMSVSEDINSSINEKINKSKRKSSIASQSCQDLDKTAILNITSQNDERSANNSCTSSICVPDEDVNAKLNKSERKLSVTDQISKNEEKSQRKSFISNIPHEDEKLTNNTSISSLSIVKADVTANENVDKSKRKPSVPNEVSENLEKSQKISLNIQNDETGNSHTSLLSIPDADVSISEKGSKSKRKSSLATITSYDFETKSTLVLSQIKDSSSVVPSTKSIESSKSFNIPKIGKDALLNHNLSLNCLTSTPMQQTDTKKLIKPLNESKSTQKNSSKHDSSQNKSLSQHNVRDEHDDSSDSDSNASDEESSKDRNMLDNEAEEASEDYESGDSQDEEERQYTKDHEIVDKGVTLTTEEEDLSDDTNYEKDSFVVSSDEDDYELLSGSGNDLGMSDNELTMSAKSKKKFDETMRKKQKKASKEMYEARHGSDYKKPLLDSTQESETEIMAPPKKNKRMRLDSNWDSSIDDDSEMKNQADISNTSEIGLKKKTKIKSLSGSINENDDVSSKFHDSTASEIGRKKKSKSKRLSESINESTKGDHATEELRINDKSVLDDSETIKVNRGKSKKSKEMSDSVCETVMEESQADTTLDSSTVICDHKIKKKKKSKLSEAVCDTKLVANEYQMEVSYKDSFSSKALNKNKRLSESVCNDSVLKEKEITIYQNSDIDSEDPLSVKIKQEPKTPQQSLDISTVNFTREEIEQVEIDENISVSKTNETSDPLQGNDSESESDVSSISENEDATNNFDAVLKELHKENNKIKTQDIFLNLQKKTKKPKNPAKEQLNLTLTKPEKKSSAPKINKGKSTLVRDSQSDDEATSDSIDLKLLFSEDSNDSSSGPYNKTENKDNKTFIPLKRTEGKTNISINASATENKLNMSVINNATKKKHRKSSQNEDVSKPNEVAEDNIFFIDTVGARDDSKVTNIPMNKELFPYKKSTKTELSSDESDDEPLEVPYSKAENEKQVVNAIQTAIPTKKGKNKKLSASLSEEKTETTSFPQNSSLDMNNLKKKKDGSESTVLVNKEVTAPKDERGKKRKREQSPVHVENVTKTSQTVGTAEKQIKKQKTSPKVEDTPEQSKHSRKSKKRKQREDDDIETISKAEVAKESSMEKVPVARLPASILSQLEDKPKKEVLEAKKARVISTTEFIVQENVPKRIKPSEYLEESIYLNDDKSEVNKKTTILKPKVLPFVPTVSTSDSGFTTKFQVCAIPEKIEFVAKAKTTANFKTDYLRDKRIKKLRLKQNRHIRLTKY